MNYNSETATEMGKQREADFKVKLKVLDGGDSA